MDETQEDMPKLCEQTAQETESTSELLRRRHNRPEVVIEVTVTHPSGKVIRETRREDAELWDRGYRQYYKVSLVTETAEKVAAQVAWEDDVARVEREQG